MKNMHKALLCIIMSFASISGADHRHAVPHIIFKNQTGEQIRITLSPNEKTYILDRGKKIEHTLGLVSSGTFTYVGDEAVNDIKIEAMRDGHWATILHRNGFDLKIDSQLDSKRRLRYKAWKVDIHPSTLAVTGY